MAKALSAGGATATTLSLARRIDEAGLARRQELLEIASEVFALRGYEAPSVAELAAAFGLQKATFYHYFQSKEELLQAVLRSGIERIYGEALDAIREYPDPVMRLKALLACHARHVEREGSRVIVYLVERHVLSEDFQKEYVALRRKYDQLFVATIEEGQRSGRMRSGDPQVMAYGLIGMYNWLVQWYQPSGPLSVDEIHQAFCGMALHGLLKPDGASEPRGEVPE
jgi:AcrR family transcriptional regulator